ncbi:RNA polymerase sigma factor [Pedosphaera parvula]|uniref:RNA polymerase, sigma-24 subunit, ECF subfamily n=1 Tax=Pedosphaera parvula (strain Ellin514) TaxID=320771 RepID=B9XGS8_PEDPL|nr:RNA polymerase sigma factor [Pedosphaera parvula]EEF60849.1 RNA polymerase, sigma-24 subunit, ECF subfamily [Pedosphaera parvula Ellin514]
MSYQEEQLCERAKAGDMAAASELVTLHYQRVYAFLRRLCGNDQDAEDLTQKTFARVWTSLASFRGRSSFSTWVHGIAYHVCIDARRKRNHLDTMTEEWWETCVAEGPSPLENTAEREMATQLYSWVETLESGVREVVHLHYYQGLSLQETAEVLGIATSTVKYRLRQALETLKAKTEKIPTN